ncbi:MAG: Dam family site-specific DNA-(adenine-N6)-methyltransferase [Anaerolineae bacterium]|nr:Dam family site-specific DNA-(adenine-N6)-methyltransferase [Anaerolineae bacterium]
MTLPRRIPKLTVPPIKCQGIKTKLVDFIASSIQWDGRGRWIEPFLGSGVVAFNIRPARARLNDSNPHIIRLYQGIYDGTITPPAVREFLEREGARLLESGGAYYYEVRARFNGPGSGSGHSLDFLFLNRAGFNGMLRFNSRGGFNVPFCRKPDRFRPAYITRIVNQVAALQDLMRGADWTFTTGDWRDILAGASVDDSGDDFVYLDPPYIGRHTDYYNGWTDDDARALAEIARVLPCGVALSMWKQNKYRANDHLDECWPGWAERTTAHFYHVGPTEDLRNAVIEALLITPGYAAPEEP